jgi:hypothetical protein
MHSDMKTYTTRSNCIRAARRELGEHARPDHDFYMLGGNTAWQWQERVEGIAAPKAVTVAPPHGFTLGDAFARVTKKQARNAMKELGTPPIMPRKTAAVRPGYDFLVQAKAVTPFDRGREAYHAGRPRGALSVEQRKGFDFEAAKMTGRANAPKAGAALKAKPARGSGRAPADQNTTK